MVGLWTLSKLGEYSRYLLVAMGALALTIASAAARRAATFYWEQAQKHAEPVDATAFLIAAPLWYLDVVPNTIAVFAIVCTFASLPIPKHDPAGGPADVHP